MFITLIADEFSWEIKTIEYDVEMSTSKFCKDELFDASHDILDGVVQNNNNNANFYFPIHNNNLKHNATESSYGQPTLFIVPSAEQGSSSTVQSFFRNITHTIQIWQFYSFRIVFDH